MKMTKTVLLGDIAEKITKGTTPTTYGASFTDSGVNFIKVESITDQGGFLVDKFVHIDEETHKSMLKRSIIEQGDILLTMAGAIGRVAQVPSEILPANTNQAVSIIRINSEEVDKRYVRYFLQSPSAKSQFNGGITQSAQPNLSLGNISKIKMPLPEIRIQKKIAGILGTIDEKIALNQRINETLEKIGQTLFKHYFITNPERKNWDIHVLSDFGEIICGKTPPKAKLEYFGGDTPFIKIPDMHGQTFIVRTQDSLTIAGRDYQPTKTLPPGSICVSCIATVGLVSITATLSQTNQQINSLVPKQGSSTYYLYFALKLMRDELISIASSGSATPNMNTSIFSKIKLIMPSKIYLEEFYSLVRPVFKQILINQNTNMILADLRDSLLPRLISGRIRA